MRRATWSLCAVLALLAAACGDGGGGAGEEAKFGIPSPLATEPGEHNINMGITCYAESVGGEVVTLDANLDVNKQITDFDNLLAQGANVLPFLPLDPNAFEGPFERAAEAGAVVVELYNPNSEAPGVVYEDSRKAGEDAVQLVAEAFPDGAKALVIGGPPIPAVLERIGGFIDNAESAGIEILEQADNLQDNVEDARVLAEDLFTKHPDVQVVFGFNDNSAIGAGLAAEGRGLDLMIFGINGTPEGIQAVADGTITATYDADQWGMGYQAAELGHQLLNGEEVQPIALDFKRWDESNVDEWVPSEERCESAG
ncbi:MAG TPA: sugar ABC transporter substrate-binding protein [Acidimicrobiia bacterium]|nr:sugar ABC transporter substrate-binding protein [Acidimicrobiia bacterium]